MLIVFSDIKYNEVHSMLKVKKSSVMLSTGSNTWFMQCKSKACASVYKGFTKNCIVFQLEKILMRSHLLIIKNLSFGLHDKTTQHIVETTLVSWACDLHLEEPCAWLNTLLSILKFFIMFDQGLHVFILHWAPQIM